MPRKNKKQDSAELAGAAAPETAEQDASLTSNTEPAGAESAPETEGAGPEGKSGDAGDPPSERPKEWTVKEVAEEYFPGKTRFSGGVAAGLARETRRRNRLAEKGY